MGETCGRCGARIITSHLPSGQYVICDAESIQAVVISDEPTKREPRVVTAWKLHSNSCTDTAAKSG